MLTIPDPATLPLMEKTALLLSLGTVLLSIVLLPILIWRLSRIRTLLQATPETIIATLTHKANVYLPGYGRRTTITLDVPGQKELTLATEPVTYSRLEKGLQGQWSYCRESFWGRVRLYLLEPPGSEIADPFDGSNALTSERRRCRLMLVIFVPLLLVSIGFLIRYL